ncbi:MAG: hypothetical protein JXA79_12665 [Deltaproteobacteria bacterium]|nr:hypothetical protein [Deltaproteobacteria bacterium]
MQRPYIVFIYLSLFVCLQVLAIIFLAGELMAIEAIDLPTFLMRVKRPGYGTEVAVLPFENLSGRFLVIDDVMKAVYQNLGEIYNLSSWESVDNVILRQRLRHTGYLTSKQASAIGKNLRAKAVILGTICEYQESPDPGFGLIIQMISTEEGTPILWMDCAFSYGRHKETWFGINYIGQVDSLINEVVKDLVKEIPLPRQRRRSPRRRMRYKQS